MKQKEIKTTKEYEETLLWIDETFDKKVKPNTIDGEKLHLALLSVKKYEDANYAIPSLPNV